MLKYSWAASQSLLKDKLLLKATVDENGKLNGFTMEGCRQDNKDYCYVFTDQNAINEYYKKPTESWVSPKLIESIYKMHHQGIVINPGREEYIITIEMLDQLFAEQK